MLRVAVNAVPLRSPLTGIGQYIRQLMAAMEARGDVEPRYFYASHWGRKAVASPVAAIDGVKRVVKKFVPYPYIVSRTGQRLMFAGGIRLYRPHLYHEPNYVALPFDGPLVVTVHDLSFVHHPQSHPKERLDHLARYLPETLARASHVITDSETVRREAIAHFGLDPARVTAIHLGVSSDFAPRTPEQTRATLARHGLEHGKYVLSVGTLEPRKNIAAAIRAWSAQDRPIHRETPLVIAGMKGWLTPELDKLIAVPESRGIVRFLGFVDDRDLPAIYAGAMAFVYPSRYEGFGLPVVEAMASGIPVITSDASCLPEIAGGAALLVPPDDDLALYKALERVAQDAALRTDLAARGIERARNFTWTRCAEETVAVYRAAVNGARL
jgi:glycosyltransferase involved in cell wall biosynthesis